MNSPNYSSPGVSASSRTSIPASPIDGAQVRKQFLLEEGKVYLNAAWFTATPEPVIRRQIELIRWLEGNPSRRASLMFVQEEFWAVHQALGRYVGADPNDLVLHVNVTQALNQALFGLRWPAGTEMIASQEEYGAIVNAARESARRQGMSFRPFPLPTQPANSDEVVAAVLSALSPQTSCVLLSHVTSRVGLVAPVERIARELRARGVMLVVDGAHGPGLVPLNLGESDIDVYGANLHKWFMGPKGTGFLYVNKALQSRLEPNIVGWGGTMRDQGKIHDAGPGGAGRFHYVFRIAGLRDLSPFMALPATMEFRRSIGGEEAIVAHNQMMLAYARQRLVRDLGCRDLSPQGVCHAGPLSCTAPPGWSDPDAANRMYERHGITIALWREPQLGGVMRISPHVWNSPADIDRLASALTRP